MSRTRSFCSLILLAFTASPLFCHSANSADSAIAQHYKSDYSVVYRAGNWPAATFPANPADGDHFKLLVDGGYYTWQFLDGDWNQRDSDERRSSLIYVIGTVDQVVEGAAIIDLGDAHTLRKDESVTVFRSSGGYFRPLGTLTISETYPTYSQARKSRRFTPEPTDIVMFVREISELAPASVHLDRFIGQQLLKNRDSNRYSSRRRLETARALHQYHNRYTGWERGKATIAGQLHGDSFAEGTSDRVEQLLSQIDLFRRLHSEGHNSTAAAGPAWLAVMSVLYGTSASDNARAIAAAVDPDSDQSVQVDDFQIRRTVSDLLFDRHQEEQNALCALIATRLRDSSGNDDGWFQARLNRTQFPYLGDDDQILEELRKVLRELRSED